MYTSISISAKYIVLLSLRITTIIKDKYTYLYIYFREIIIKINSNHDKKVSNIYICICRVEGDETQDTGKEEGEEKGVGN